MSEDKLEEVLKEVQEFLGKLIDDNKDTLVKDNYFEELKEAEILRERLNTLRDISEYTGKYFSHQWITRNVLQMTDEDITKMEEQIAEEKALGGHSDSDDPF